MNARILNSLIEEAKEREQKILKVVWCSSCDKEIALDSRDEKIECKCPNCGHTIRCLSSIYQVDGNGRKL